MPLVTSCVIGGTDLIGSLLVKPTRLRFGTLGEVSTATLEFIGVASSLSAVLLPGASVSIGVSGAEGEAVFGEAVTGEAVFGEGGSESTAVYVGTVAEVATSAQIVSNGGVGYTRFTLSCQGSETLLTDATIPTEANYTITSDASIVTAQIIAAGVGIDVSNVSEVLATCSIRVLAGWTLRQFMDELCSRTGAIYYMRGNALYYHAEGAASAPYNIKELEDCGSGDIAPLWSDFRHHKSWTNRANRVTVLGAVGSGGTRYSATVDDLTSQGLYGVMSRTISDPNIQSTAEATARGNVELANYGAPQETGSFETRTDGFYVGQSITITMPSEALDATMFIRSVTWSWETPSVTTYSIEFGQFSANLIRRLTRIQAEARGNPYVPVAVPAPLSITTAHFGSTIEPVGLVDQAPNSSGELPIGKTTSVVYNVNDRKTYRWDSVTGTYRRRVGAGDLEADSVTAGTIAAGAIRAIDAAFDAGAIQTADIGDLQVTAAKIADLSVGTSKIDDLAVTDAKIANAAITGAKIVNAAIETAHIGTAAVTTAKIADAAITEALIANATITGAKIASATITSAHIADLSAGKITAGEITADISIAVGNELTVSGDFRCNGTMTGTFNFSNTIILHSAGSGILVDGTPVIGPDRSGNFTDVQATSVGVSGSVDISSGSSYRVNGVNVVKARGASISDASTSHAFSSTFVDTELEAACDALGAKLNTIISRLEEHGLISTV